MNKKRTLLFRLGAVVLLVAVGALMMLIGRGHTVYFDNKTLEYQGKTYEAPYKIVVRDGEESLAKIYNKAREDRGMAPCIGQKFQATLEITWEEGGAEEIAQLELELPYSMDGIAINMPAYLAGLPVEAYLSEFIIAEPEAPAEDEEIPAPDDFGLGDI